MPDTDQDLQTLGRVVIEILEEAAFLFCEPMLGEQTEDVSPEVLVAKLGFRGPSSGDMVLGVPLAVASELAANLLGLEPEDPEVAGKGPEAVGEILNIIGGALLKEWFGLSSEFEMGIPTVVKMNGNEFVQDASRASVHLPLLTEEGCRIDAAVVR